MHADSIKISPYKTPFLKHLNVFFNYSVVVYRLIAIQVIKNMKFTIEQNFKPTVRPMNSLVCNLCPTYLPLFENFKVSLRKLSFEGCLEEEH